MPGKKVNWKIKTKDHTISYINLSISVLKVIQVHCFYQFDWKIIPIFHSSDWEKSSNFHSQFICSQFVAIQSCAKIVYYPKALPLLWYLPHECTCKQSLYSLSFSVFLNWTNQNPLYLFFIRNVSHKSWTCSLNDLFWTLAAWTAHTILMRP